MTTNLSTPEKDAKDGLHGFFSDGFFSPVLKPPGFTIVLALIRTLSIAGSFLFALAMFAAWGRGVPLHGAEWLYVVFFAGVTVFSFSQEIKTKRRAVYAFFAVPVVLQTFVVDILCGVFGFDGVVEFFLL